MCTIDDSLVILRHGDEAAVDGVGEDPDDCETDGSSLGGYQLPGPQRGVDDDETLQTDEEDDKN